MKNIFKIISLFLVIAMTASMLAACASGGVNDSADEGKDKDPTSQTPTENYEDPVEPMDVLGACEGKSYKNEYFDISLNLPAHWYFESAEKISEIPLTVFSARTDEQLLSSEFSVECRAVNDANDDVIEITVEKKKEGVSDPWYSISEYFKNKPKGWNTTRTSNRNPTIGGKSYESDEYINFEGGEGTYRVAYYYTMVGDYILCITMINDGFYIGDDHANGRMLDWFGSAKNYSTSMYTEGGGYYLNDIMSPSPEGNMNYQNYIRNESFCIAGNTYYDGIPLDNGNSSGVGKTNDTVFYLDGKTYTEFSFTVGSKDSELHPGLSPDEYAAFEILLDGEQVFEERHYHFEKAKTHKVDITGAKKMVIRIRDNWNVTSLYIADPVLSVEPRNIDDTVQPVKGTVDFLDAAMLFCQGQRTNLIDGSGKDTFNVAGKDYNKGIILTDGWGGTDRTYFNLGGKYEQFNFSVGIIKDSYYPNSGWLNIYLDGVKILDVELEYDHPTESYSLDVSGGHILCIENAANPYSTLHQGDYALYNMTLGEPVIEAPDKVEPGSYKLISEISLPFSSKGAQVFDGSTKYRGHYLGDIFYNEGVSLLSMYSFIGSPLDAATPAKATFKLGKNFKYLTFTVGRVDRSHVKDDVLVVYGDGVELARYPLTATAFPKSYELNIEGVDVLQFSLLGMPALTRGTYMVADIGVHTHEIGELDFNKPEQEPFPDTVDLMERFKPYEYMSAEGNGHDAIRYFNGIYDGNDNRKFFTIDGVNHTRGFVLSTCVYLSLDAGGLIGAGSFGVAGFVGGALALMAIAASSEVSQASFACFNLQKQYKTMTFNVGVLDNDKGSDGRKQPYDTLYVIADDKIVGEYKLTSDMETTEITVDVANCERLTFWLDHNSNSPSYGIFDATLTK